jgi:3-isopropylmalate dehydratase small subunit
VLFNFGCFGFCGSADVDNNGTVDDADLLIVLFNFGCGS